MTHHHDRHDCSNHGPCPQHPQTLRFRFTLTLESGTLLEFDVTGSTAGNALHRAQRRTADYDLTGGETVIGIMLQELEPCGDYAHAGYPRPDDRPCQACSGTGWVVRPSVAEKVRRLEVSSQTRRLEEVPR